MVDIEQVDGTLKISYFNANGELAIDRFTIPADQLFEWEYCGPGEKAFPGVLSWDGKPVRKKRVRYLSKWRIEEYLTSLPAYETERIYATHTPKKFFVDIEVEVGDEWPRPDTAKFPVTAIAFCNDDKIVCLGTKQLSSDQILNIRKRLNVHFKDHVQSVDFNYLYFQSEYDMLVSFFYKAAQKMPLITGWNFTGYDWPYLFNRCKRLNIDTSVCSPSGKLSGILPLHRLVNDYMEIYKKWDRIIDIKENNTLDYVAKAALGIQKVKYNGTLQDLYEQDFESYIFYNAVDTKLVELIDRKLSTMQTFLSLGNLTRVEACKAFSPIYMAEAAMCREFLRRGRVFPRTEKSNKKRESYEGAFVVEPKTGLYEWITSFDFASLYPSIMRQWNISPESYLRNLKPGEEADLANEIVCASGAVFQKHPDSVFRTILTDYYGQRKTAKKAYEAIEEEIEQLKSFLK